MWPGQRSDSAMNWRGIDSVWLCLCASCLFVVGLSFIFFIVLCAGGLLTSSWASLSFSHLSLSSLPLYLTFVDSLT